MIFNITNLKNNFKIILQVIPNNADCLLCAGGGTC